MLHPTPHHRLHSLFLATFFAALSAACSTAQPAQVTGAGTEDAGTPDGSVPAATAVASVKLSLCAPAYTVPVKLGDGDAQTFDLLFDTGSGPVGIASSSCTSCSEASVAPLYTPGASAVDQDKKAGFQYAGGTWAGSVFRENTVLGGSPSVSVDLVAIETQNKFFYPPTDPFFTPAIACGSPSGSSQGILGAAPPGNLPKGTTSFIDRFVETTQAPNVFATELCPSGGMLWLGGYDSKFTTAAPQYVPLTKSTASITYGVNLATIGVNGKEAAVATTANPNAIVDTGTVFFAVPKAAYQTITAEVAASPKFATIFGGGASWFSNPYANCKVLTQTKAELDEALPPLTLTFGSDPPVSLQVPATESYLVDYQVGQEHHYCPALVAIPGIPALKASAILGAPVLRSHVVIFDRENQRIGFAPHTPCP